MPASRGCGHHPDAAPTRLGSCGSRCRGGKTPAHDNDKTLAGPLSTILIGIPLAAFRHPAAGLCRGRDGHFSSVSVRHQFRADGASETEFGQGLKPASFDHVVKLHPQTSLHIFSPELKTRLEKRWLFVFIVGTILDRFTRASEIFPKPASQTQHCPGFASVFMAGRQAWRQAGRDAG